jgi:hypothetical protein
LLFYIGSIFLSVYGIRLKDNLAEYVPPAAIAAGLPASSTKALVTALNTGTAAALAKVPGMTAAIQRGIVEATRHAYELSFRTIFLVSLAFGGLAIISSWFNPDTAKHMTGFINTKVDGTQSKVGHQGRLGRDTTS